ncbi:unnamed protein product [Heligmosomoides polygyrus]|uniref:TCTP domain-containing protein n=1 Tax=Heligmosomoides polygyrus TaxID=6339 RepID=A0A183FTC4_HELPZ|nr:unnamed protein product [Heligmosomoides polygyrus]
MDVFTDDELSSDSFPMTLVDELVYVFKEGEEGSDEIVERGIDIVLNRKLVEMNCYEDQSTFKSYVKSFMKKKKIQAWILSLLDKKRWKTLQFFIGERIAEGVGDGQVAIIEYRDVNGEEVPTSMLIKEAIISEKI